MQGARKKALHHTINTPTTMNLASVDIGSNGARMLVKSFSEGDPVQVKKEFFLRYPLRLGADVFTLGKISKRKQKEMEHFLRIFTHLLALYQVEQYRACATSAMRDAENGLKVMRKLKEQTGIQLEIIPGEEEAAMLCNNLVEKSDSNQGNFAYVDVGGGSTEVSIIHDGILAESHSYNIGTLRMLGDRVSAATKISMQNGLYQAAKHFGNVQVIGSGGNINKLCRLITQNKNATEFQVTDLQAIYDELRQLSVEERMEKYFLRPDRADVIVPAAEIFLGIAAAFDCPKIVVPNISMADSIVDGIYKSMRDAANKDQ